MQFYLVPFYFSLLFCLLVLLLFFGPFVSLFTRHIITGSFFCLCLLRFSLFLRSSFLCFSILLVGVKYSFISKYLSVDGGRGELISTALLQFVCEYNQPASVDPDTN